MSYATAQDLLRKFGNHHIAELADPTRELVTGELLHATIYEQDRSAYSAQEVAAADEAQQAINQALAHAHSTINSYLSERYQTPIAATVVTASSLPVHCLYLTQFELMDNDDKETEQGKERAAAAIQWLKDIVAGKAGLGGANEQTQDANTIGMTVRRGTNSRFNWASYGSNGPGFRGSQGGGRP